MSVLITDDIIKQANMSEPEFKLELAVFLYSNDILAMGKASEFAGLPKAIFQKILSERGINVSYDKEEFDRDLATIRKIFGEL